MNVRSFLLLLFAAVLSVSCDDGTQKSYWDNGKLKSELRYVDGKLTDFTSENK